MLNYIWAGLVIISLVFALISDVRDAARDTYRNDKPLPVMLTFPEGYQPSDRRVPVVVRIDPGAFGEFYRTDARPDSFYHGVIVQTQQARLLRIDAEAHLPEPLSTIRGYSASGDDELQGALAALRFTPDSLTASSGVVFEPVRFPKMHAIAGAAFDFAETAATLAIGLIGVLALFLGLLKIAEASGLIDSLVRFTQPLFRPLFPEIPDGHPALGMIV
ncbi:MAG TPA: nucleoside recognition protein, partial [Rhodothermales bacterium]